jgi:heme/copper-type cytochrome/quinol oxidase subunit 2
MSIITRARTAHAAVALGVVTLIAISGCGASDPSTSSTTSTSGATTTSAIGGTPSSTPAPPATGTLVEITVAGGQVAGGVQRVDVHLGDNVTIRITSDIAEELHIHGYDLKRELTPGAPAELSFTADIPGVFEAELEHSGLKVVELRVA